MNRIIVFAGTTEGRELAKTLMERGMDPLICVASLYGEEVLEGIPHDCVHVGRMDASEMEQMIRENGAAPVVDATHPYAVEASQNIRSAALSAGAEYLRLIRRDTVHETGSGVVGADRKKEGGQKDVRADREEEARRQAVGAGSKEEAGLRVIRVNSIGEAAAFLKEHDGKALITTGSRELMPFAGVPDYKDRLTVRVLPSADSITACRKAGFEGKQIIAMQGPFSAEMNELLLKETEAAWLVTKESGETGGFPEKMEAAKRSGAGVILVRRPLEEDGYSADEIIRRLDGIKEQDDLTVRPDTSLPERTVYLIGTGMGDEALLTREAECAIRESDVLIGAARMLESFSDHQKPCFQSYKSEEIRAYLDDHPGYRSAAVLLSGDVGFYSGAKKLLLALTGPAKNHPSKTEAAAFAEPGEDRQGTPAGGGDRSGPYNVRLVCGISSVQYFCSKCGIPWEDVRLMSAHGRDQNLAAAIRKNTKVFTLAGDGQAVRKLADDLSRIGFGATAVTAGVDLSYKDERIFNTTVAELAKRAPDGLTVLLFRNPDAGKRVVTYGIPDEAFVRGNVPMTKEEVRSVVLSKLRLTENAVLYDIGSGTGSVAVEAALLVDRGRVFAIERKPEAVSLIRQNAARFGVTNIEVVEGSAPDALAGLPAPTHAFIGGSGGNLEEICETLLALNPEVRIVATAVSLESIAAITNHLKAHGYLYQDVIQVSSARSRKMGPYHMMMGLNPILIAAFDDLV